MGQSTEIKERLREYILAEFLHGESPANLKDDTPLLTSGVLNSIDTLNLVTFAETAFGIEVEAHEASIENFDRISDMVPFIEQKKAASRSKA
jgi:acyl carrier protein